MNGIIRTNADKGEVFVDLAVRLEFSTRKTREGQKEVTYICQIASVNETSSRGSDIASSLSGDCRKGRNNNCKDSTWHQLSSVYMCSGVVYTKKAGATHLLSFVNALHQSFAVAE